MSSLLRLCARRLRGILRQVGPTRAVALAALATLVAGVLVASLLPDRDSTRATLTASAGPSAAADSGVDMTPAASEPSPTPTPSRDPEPTAQAASPSPTAEATHEAPPSGHPPPQPEPSQSLHGDPPCAFDGSGCQDDDGWSAEFAGCRNAKSDDVPSDEPSAEVIYGVIATLTVPSDHVVRGQSLETTLTLRNTSETEVSLDLSLGDTPRQAFLIGASGGSSAHWTDAIEVVHVDLEPGESWSMHATLRASSCGSSDTTPESPMAPGHYTGGAHWSFWDAKIEGEAQPLSPRSGEFSVGMPITVD